MASGCGARPGGANTRCSGFFRNNRQHHNKISFASSSLFSAPKSAQTCCTQRFALAAWAAAEVSDICLASSGSSSARYGLFGSVRWVFMAMQYLQYDDSHDEQSRSTENTTHPDRARLTLSSLRAELATHHLIGFTGSEAISVWCRPTGCPISEPGPTGKAAANTQRAVILQLGFLNALIWPEDFWTMAHARLPGTPGAPPCST